MQVLGILAFVVALLVSVMLHEFGHFITARKFNMRVSEFFVGFGKRLWSITRGETEYGIKAIPAGGYCRIEGMTPQDQMPAGEAHRAFYLAGSGRKLIVLGAGSFLHFVLGFLLIFTLFAGVGVNSLKPVIGEVVKDSPAQAAGILKGDEIVAINGVRVTEWAKDLRAISESKGHELSFTIKREGQEIEIKATPKRVIEARQSRYVVGIISTVGITRVNPLTSVKYAGLVTKDFLIASVKSLISLPSKIPALWGQTVGGQERDPNGLVGVVGAARVSGQTLSSEAMSWSERIGTFILLVASLNIFVGVFNLLPILPLDGGHMAVAIVDEIRALFARLRHRARPAPIDVNVLTPITFIVFVVLAALTVLLLVADIFNPITLNL